VVIAASNGIIILALMYVSLQLFMPFLQGAIEDYTTRSVVGLLVSLSVAAPFLWALMARRPNNLAYKELWLERKYSRGPLLLVEILRIIVGILLIGFWVFALFSTEVAILVAVPIVIVVLIIFGKRIQSFYQRIEVRFLTNLNARETAAENTFSANVSRKRASIQSDLVPWDVHIVELEVSPQASFIGKTLSDLAWREKYGINIIYIKRGEKLIHVPGRNAIILPFDHVGIIATDDQMQVFKPVFDNTENGEGESIDIDEIALKKIVVDEHTKLSGLNIRSSGLRERTNGLVIGIQRNDERILNPDSSMVFQWGDIVWVVGERKKIKKLAEL
jgi:CPA2 family monovalent cation:H+ antiporter-2